MFAGDLSCEIVGLQEMSRALDQMPKAIADQILRPALQAGGDVVLTAAEATAPVRTGELKEDIITRIHVDPYSAYVIIGPGYNRAALPVTGFRPSRHRRGELEAVQDTTSSPGVYGKFVEEGHGPPGSAKEKRAAKRRGKEIEYGSSSTPPHPWLRPAWEASKNAAMDAVRAVMTERFKAVAETIRSLMGTSGT